MGKRDIQTSDYFENEEYFADLVNGIFFRGLQVIRPGKLQETSKELLYFKTGKGKKVILDNVRKYFDGTLICIYVIEHQKNIDYHMVFRNMLSEALEYDRQWRQLKRKHREKHDLKSGHEIISGMKKSDRFNPVITLVVYYGEEKWDGPVCLHDLLDFKGDNSPLRQYVENYHIHLFDYHDYENFDMFHTELRQVFTFLKHATNRNSLQKLIAEHPKDYYNVSKETCELIAALTQSEIFQNTQRFRNEVVGGINMYKGLEELKLEGIEEGISAFICSNLEDGFSREKVLDKLQKYFRLSPDKAADYFERFAVDMQRCHP